MLQIEDGTVAMISKSCYFLRSPSVTQPIDTSKVPADIYFGELGKNPLASVAALVHTYKNILMASESWSQLTESQQQDFISEVDGFVSNINEALNNIESGLELQVPADAATATIETQAQLLEEWCNQIERSLSTGKHDGIVGPRAELEYWRRRMQKLFNITQQLQRRECKAVISALAKSSTTSSAAEHSARVSALLRRFKQMDLAITEAINEAKDNVKYLSTLERFIEPLYTGTPTTIIDSIPALLNSVKMIHTIARYYNTSERMTNLFSLITDQMICNCTSHLLGGSTLDGLWDADPQDLVRRLEACLKLNETYQEQYRVTKTLLEQTPKGKQFDFPENAIFGKFDLFCRRVMKLIDLFSTIDQFQSLSKNRLEGMESLTALFESIVRDFRLKRHDLLDYHSNKFDRDYVEFNVRITDLETKLQQFINTSFENITSIEHSLQLLKKFQNILERESLKSDLDSKLNIIFQNYGLELAQVYQLYDKEKHDPPLPRNLPTVAGNITWSRHLLKRIEEPMKQFESNQNVLAGKDAKRIIKTYNKMAKTLVAFEYLWYQAWVQSIENAKAGLQATLIIRHPDDGKLYVNFDQEILQLIREAKCLDRMGIEVRIP